MKVRLAALAIMVAPEAFAQSEQTETHCAWELGVWVCREQQAPRSLTRAWLEGAEEGRARRRQIEEQAARDAALRAQAQRAQDLMATCTYIRESELRAAQTQEQQLQAYRNYAACLR